MINAEHSMIPEDPHENAGRAVKILKKGDVPRYSFSVLRQQEKSEEDKAYPIMNKEKFCLSIQYYALKRTRYNTYDLRMIMDQAL